MYIYNNTRVERSKTHKAAVTACIRKLLTILNAMLKTQSTWESCCP